MSIISPFFPRMNGPPAKPIPAAFVPPQITFAPSLIASSSVFSLTPKQRRECTASHMSFTGGAGQVGCHVCALMGRARLRSNHVASFVGRVMGKLSSSDPLICDGGATFWTFVFSFVQVVAPGEAVAARG